VRRADNLTTFMCRLSRNLGASTSWNPVGLHRPVMGSRCVTSHFSTSYYERPGFTIFPPVALAVPHSLSHTPPLTARGLDKDPLCSVAVEFVPDRVRTATAHPQWMGPLYGQP
jgi:hypothetical protein